MKEITNYKPNKYSNSEYKLVENNVYSYKKIYVTSLSFIQEPEFNEGLDSSNISQYPLEDVLDEFSVYISDDYKDLNSKKTNECYLEFASNNLEDIKKLRKIIGKHVYNRELNNCIELIIE